MTESLIRVMVRVLSTRVQLAAGFALLFDRVDFSDVGPQQVGVRGLMRSEHRVEIFASQRSIGGQFNSQGPLARGASVWAPSASTLEMYFLDERRGMSTWPFWWGVSTPVGSIIVQAHRFSVFTEVRRGGRRSRAINHVNLGRVARG